MTRPAPLSPLQISERWEEAHRWTGSELLTLAEGQEGRKSSWKVELHSWSDRNLQGIQIAGRWATEEIGFPLNKMFSGVCQLI